MNIAHIGIHYKANKNSGDTLLFEATRKAVELVIADVQWTYIEIWKEVSETVLELLNRQDLIIIGGGGLLLKDQKGAESSTSGWQWNCSLEMLDEINTPIAMLGVGYNRFRSQEDFDPIFTEHIQKIYNKSVLIGLRNYGSINCIKPYLDSHEKIAFHPCPTTFLPHLYQLDENTNQRIISINVAYDRPQYRFNDSENTVFQNTARFVKYLNDNDFSVDITMHKDIDGVILPFLKGLTYRVNDLTNASARQIVDYYNSIYMSIGMRGHAQLIPFGLGKKIVSLISHNKIQYFLDDIDEDWGVEVLSQDYFDQLIRKFELVNCLDHHGHKEQIERFKNQTIKNIQYIENVINN